MEPIDLGADYPQEWEDFIGQEEMKSTLKIACKAAQIRGVALPHTLLASGMPGVGKTAVGFLLGRTMGTRVHPVSGRISVNDARMIVATMQDHEILLIDEIHRCAQGSAANDEWLLHLLQDGVILGPLGPEPVPSITVVGTTTDVGRLRQTIIERFKVRPEITAYTIEEATRLVEVMTKAPFAESSLRMPPKTNLEAIAVAANQNPRQIKAIVSNLRDLIITDTIKYEAKVGYEIDRALAWLGLSADGLNRTAQRYLKLMVREFPNGAGEKALIDRLQEPGGLGWPERVLMDKGLVVKTRSGRFLTQAGIRRARELMEEAAA